jgi:hypothetical protein
MGFLSPLKKAVGKVTNSKIAKSVPGGKSIGKSIRNAPGMKVTPPTGGLAPSPQLQQQQIAPQENQINAPVQLNTPMQPMAPPPPMPTPNQDFGMGEAMSRPSVMPRAPMQEMPQTGEAQGGLAPQMDFSALAQRAPQVRSMGRARPMRPMY